MSIKQLFRFYLNLKNIEILSFAVNQEKQIDNIFKKFPASNSMSAETRRLVGPSSGIMYGLCKVHKDVIDNCQSFQTILSDCNWTRTHNHLAPKQTQNHLAKLTSLAKWLSVPFRTKWLWVQVQLQSLKLQICTYFE